MQEKLAFPRVSGPADIAHVGFLPGVRAAVLVQVPLLTERFTTEITCKRPGKEKNARYITNKMDDKTRL